MNYTTNIITESFLTGMEMTVHLENGDDIVLTPTVTEEEYTAVFSYNSETVTATLRAESSDSATVLRISLKSDSPLAARAVSFATDISFADKTLGCHMDCPWWTMCSFPENSDDVSDLTQSFLFEKDGGYISAVFLTGNVFCTHAFKDGLHLDVRCPGYTELEGAFMSVFADSEPMAAIKKNYIHARTADAINVPLRNEREYPELFEKFGWCSWNAFYQDVTAEKLYTKLREFKEKNVPVKWIIIDDGWSLVRDGKLASFDSDPEKFPEGLGGCIKRIKEEFEIEGVGVWHTLNGYWQGIDPESAIAKEYADCLMTTVGGMLIPSTDPDKAFPFWDAFHSHLADCGVDFVKVDNQSSSYHYLENTVSATSGSVGIHEAIEESIVKNFGGKVINCMGMGMANVFARPFTAISRNSDDFFPDRENGFSKHLRQNLYGALWHSELYFCDYDMWWSGKSAPVQSGVLRAISGGPVYVSDAVGDTDPSNLLPVIGCDGDICRMDDAAIPTTDCLFTNCEWHAPLQKAYNRKGDAVALALFNLRHEDGTVTETFKFGVIPCLHADRDYVAYEYFTGKFSRVNSATEETVTVELNDVLAYSLYPVQKDDGGEFILLGDCSRYFGIAANTEKVYLSDILS